MKQPKKQTQDLTAGERLSLEIARLFPESFRIWGNRVSVKENAGSENTREQISADLASMYSAKKKSKGKK